MVAKIYVIKRREKILGVFLSLEAALRFYNKLMDKLRNVNKVLGVLCTDDMVLESYPIFSEEDTDKIISQTPHAGAGSPCIHYEAKEVKW